MIMWKILIVVPAVMLLGCASDESVVEPPASDQQTAEATPAQTDPLTSLGEEAPADSVARSEGGTVDGPLMRHPVRSDNEEGLSAEVRGILELEKGCLYLSIDEIDERYPVLWPAQTAWDAQRKVVELPTGDEIAVGELAYGGGGYFYVDDIANMAGPEAGDLAGRCADNTYGEIAVVNNYDTAISPG